MSGASISLPVRNGRCVSTSILQLELPLGMLLPLYHCIISTFAVADCGFFYKKMFWQQSHRLAVLKLGYCNAPAKETLLNALKGWGSNSGNHVAASITLLLKTIVLL